jgi:hypothetical protein
MTHHPQLDSIMATFVAQALYADLETPLNISGPFGAVGEPGW